MLSSFKSSFRLILKVCTILAGTAFRTLSTAQDLYFPPQFGDVWETYPAEDLDWCEDNIDSLYNFLEERNTKAFILLYKGRIVLENYFGNFTQDSLWYWASAGKALTAILVGIAQQEGDLSIDDLTSDYLGEDWTICDQTEEDAITIRHQLTMTTGLNDGVEDVYCTLPECLECVADPGTRWAYHNGPYTLLDDVITEATGTTLNAYEIVKLGLTTGIVGSFIPVDYNNVFFSKPRSMARFGLLMLNKGVWNGNPILTDTAYVRSMLTPSQKLNPSYGYLWWLNGQENFMIPGLQVVFPGPMFASAPPDVYAALGRDGQFINVAPSDSIVWIRMGSAPGTGLISATLNDDIWQYINRLPCTSVFTGEVPSQPAQLKFYPNPNQGILQIDLTGIPPHKFVHLELLTSTGVMCMESVLTAGSHKIDISHLVPGIYFARYLSAGSIHFQKIIRSD